MIGRHPGSEFNICPEAMRGAIVGTQLIRVENPLRVFNPISFFFDTKMSYILPYYSNIMGNVSGVVYTKSWVVDMMLDVCGYMPDRDLSRFRILEPSCGEGAFMKRIVERLCDSAEEFGRGPEELSGSVAAYDLDPEKVSICRDNVRDMLRARGWDVGIIERLVTGWIRVSDFLLTDSKDYDFVVGNPPYIRSSEISSDQRSMYMGVLKTMTMGTDMFVGFIEKGLRALRPEGKLCYICADRWMQNSYGKKLRRFILSEHHMDLICRMHQVDAFEEKVDAYPAIVMINNSKEDTIYIDCSSEFDPSCAASLVDCINGKAYDLTPSFSACALSDFDIAGGPWPLIDSKTLDMIVSASKKFPSLEGSGVSIGIGVATGNDKVYITKNPNLVEQDRMLPLLCSPDIVGKEPPSEPRHWLVNPWDADGDLVDLSDYPALGKYLGSNDVALSKRHVVKKNKAQWYRTIDKVKLDLLKKDKLLFCDFSARSEPILDRGVYYPSHNLYWLTSDNWNLEALGGLLMSDQIESVIDAYGVKMRGKTMRFQAQYLRLIHIPDPVDVMSSHMSGLIGAFRSRDKAVATDMVSEIFDSF